MYYFSIVYIQSFYAKQHNSTILEVQPVFKKVAPEAYIWPGNRFHPTGPSKSVSKMGLMFPRCYTVGRFKKEH